MQKLSKDEIKYQIKRLIKSLEVQILDKIEYELIGDRSCELIINYEIALIKDHRNKKIKISILKNETGIIPSIKGPYNGHR